ncbi:MAG TPA: hypothetical protein EYN68_06425 [Candidatus Marinimicrobia bacterium]|nr:hypothetical protein [Candidatus Neomarinimicrobiota bacterium]HHZ99170.1 hypothetical protein [Candidatus Neomarinimicrobiota bacterium]HIB96205.1 hypothetical protein [Candidatus Neomarinimicrobiota bacterium]HIN62299.1 hypothetical protein [Candidatus Neomarinimicrobiota bacterium]HIO56418.1 hypothetical protein [Candidatus Neomarinimicrobiota bacterium]
MTKHITSILFLIFSCNLFAQEEASEESEKDSLYFTFEPEELTIEVGDSARVRITLMNDKGAIVENPFYIYGRRRALTTDPRLSDSSGVAVVKVKAFRPGSHELNARTITRKREDRVRGTMPVEIPYPPLKSVTFVDPAETIYEGTTVSFKTTVYDEAGLERKNAVVTLKSREPRVADFDPHGNLSAKLMGRITVEASVENITATHNIRIISNPVRGMSLSSPAEDARTGDVIHFTATPLTRSGKAVPDVPVKFSWTGVADYGIGLPANAQVTQTGKFVAETAGIFTVRATTGGYTASKIIKVVPRDVRTEMELVGHGLVSSVATSDLWVWPGVGQHAGKDFAVTGTWGANGEAYFWDVTDPSNIVSIDTITVDARTVNDVKVSEDGKVCVISREGASNRKNGIVILDVSDPYNVEILSEYNDDLTGGVHNVFVYQNHVFAVNNGRKFDIINIENPREPERVSVFELKTPGHSIHDVWVVDGIAYTSNWTDGVQMVDVGGLPFIERNLPMIQSNPLLQIAGKGNFKNPVSISYKEDQTGRNHAAFPFLSESTGKFFVIMGDEWFPFRDSNAESMGRVSNPRGGFHFIDMTDTHNPEEVALYQVPEAGSHNLWVQGDTLYTAYYQGGLRVVDISGELLGDIYKQGREIAFFHGYSPDGYIPNAPNAWGPQPYKGLVYFSDMNSGLYAVKFVDKEKKETD